MANNPDSMEPTAPSAPRTDGLVDSLELPPLPPSDGGGDLAAALGERRLRAVLLGEQLPALRVDRYVLERQLGAGGMGSVWRAWDEQLRRAVALKFLHRDYETDEGQRRFEREAQGLAQLSHPNVVAVYDVGRHEGRIWLAMEFVPGRTLRAWQAEVGPSPDQLLAVWIGAGRGLAAVHAAGLIHRDVKPDNIMMGDDERVRLVDFGLVRQTGTNELGTTLGASHQRGQHPSTEGRDGSATQTGGFVGTPAYAAPEQFAGLDLDARADQYAFCVGLWEALTGTRPPAPEHRDAPLPVAEAARMSARVRRALERGLALHRDERFDDMDGLLDALAPPRRAWLAPALAAMLAGALGVGLALAREPDPVDPCAGTSATIDRTWTADRREALVTSYGPDAAESIGGIIDAWALAWRGSATDSCEAHARGELASEAVYEGQRGCLERANRGLDRLLGAIEANELPDSTVALAWLADLPEPSTCSTGVGGLMSERPPPALRDELDALEHQLDRVRHDLDDDSFGARLERARALQVEARALAWPPLIDETTRLVGHLALFTGDAELARHQFGLAHDLAIEHGDPQALTRAAGGMVQTEVQLELDADAGAWWLEREATAVETEGEPPDSRGRLALHRGHLAELRADLDGAELAYAESIAALREAGPRFASLLAHVLRVRANLLVVRGRAEEAIEDHEEARSLELADGTPPQMPASVEQDAAVDALAAGDPALAAKRFAAALSSARARHGARSIWVLRAHIGLSGAHDALGQVEQALDHAQRADALAQAILGPTHPVRGEALSALGAAHYRQRHFDAAVASFERALTIAIERTPAASLDRGYALLNLGDALYEQGRDDLRARALLERARTIIAATIGARHPVMAVVLKPLAGLALRADEIDHARALLDEALAIVDAGPGSVVEAAEIRWLAARAHARAGDRAAARDQAELAAQAFATMGEAWHEREREIRDWLTELPTPTNP